MIARMVGIGRLDRRENDRVQNEGKSTAKAKELPVLNE
jgi:hypothetical protein